ncbi:Hypothetical protein NTJ_03392 [Nesidiocoris tenuis]|uniref:Uncharacterized protein n=1 Tax=Nesidiocoris tenuis TaxID=355587 RepID=A0ABN7AH99_9HEMI|nr:Hypothetical protein NTJ_03392 [Nesidiocoris tenuis]
MISNEVLHVNASLHHINNDTNLSRNDTIAIRTNSTASSGNLNNNLTAEDSQHDLSGSDRENLKLISDSNTKINGNSEGGELLKTTVTRSPITTMGDDEHIGEMKNDSTSNSSIAPSRQDKALFSGEQNESLSDLPDGTNDDGPYGNNNVEPSTSSTPNGINSSILSEYTESQTAANQVSWNSENASDPITGIEEERFEFAESPSTTILTSNSTEKAISFNETDFDSPDYGRTTGAPQNGSPEYTSVQYSTHRTILPEPAIDWSTEVVTYSPVIQNSTPYDDAIRSDNVTEAPDVMGNSVNVEGPKIIGDGTTELTHETPRFENDLVTKTSNAATTWHVTSSFTADSTTIKPGYSSNNSSNGTVDLASAGTGEEQTTILEQTTTLNTTVKYQENVQNKTGKALTVGLPDATEGPQSIVTDVSGKVLFVESSESTESPDEAEEIFSNSSTTSSQDLVIDEKTGEVMRVDSPESTENPDEDGTNVEVTTDRNNQDEVTSKSDSQISVSDIPIKMPGPSENIDNSEEHQNQTTETISTKSFEDIQVDDTTGNISNALSPESNDTLDEDEVMPTQGIEANQGKPNKPDASIEGEQEENHDEITQDINTNQGEPNPSDANIEGEQAENHDESTEESVDDGSAPTTVRVEIPSTEWITATPNQMPQLKIENALAPVEPTEDDSDVKFPTEPHPKYPPTLPQSQTQPPPTTKAPTTPRHTVVYEDWLKFNNFTIIFPTRASFHNRIIYDEQPSPVAGYEFANIYKRYDHPGFMQIVPLRPPRRRFNHF